MKQRRALHCITLIRSPSNQQTYRTEANRKNEGLSRCLCGLHPDDGGNTALRNVATLPQHYMTS